MWHVKHWAGAAGIALLAATQTGPWLLKCRAVGPTLCVECQSDMVCMAGTGERGAAAPGFVLDDAGAEVCRSLRLETPVRCLKRLTLGGLFFIML